MTPREAQEVLLSCKPGSEPADDPQVAEALDLVRADADLRQWYEQHRTWDSAVRQKFRDLPVPADLKASILAGEKVVAGPAHWWNRRAAILAVAAMVTLLVTIGLMLVRRAPPTSADTFAQFRTRMIGTVLREYRMDLETNDMAQIRSFLVSRGAPADYQVPAGLQKLKLAGCGKLDWQGKPVAMVCFEDQRERLVWMFVAKAANWNDRPSSEPDFARVISCATASWSEGDAVYVIGGETSEAEIRKLL